MFDDFWFEDDCLIFQIAREERLKTDLTTLLALCEKTDNDIRSCVNTLQVILNIE